MARDWDQPSRAARSELDQPELREQAIMAAEAAKAEGNKALQAKNYDEAVKKYTEAIAFDATQHTYFEPRGGLHATEGL